MRTVSVNLDQTKGNLNRYFSKCVGAGRAAEVMRRQAYEQLCMIQRECPFEYIRFHGLFHDEMGIVHRKQDGSLFFNFQYVDLLFDSLLEIHMRPVVELGMMPMALASGDSTVFWWKLNKTMPKDVGEWESLVEAFVRHVTHRYGEEEIKRWYFEVWNEPNLEPFFRSDDRMNEYFLLYDAAARAVKRVCSDYKVGGPATAGLRWIPETIAHCKENNVPLDFISTHQYCTTQLKDDAFDEFGQKKLWMETPDHLTDSVNACGAAAHAEGLPFLITEWSASYSPHDAVHDSYFSAPFILHAIKSCEGNVDLFSYWVYTDIFEEAGTPKTPFHGGFGLINIQSMPKPSYYAFTLLAKLGDTELDCEDADAYACRKDDEAQILFWNLAHPEQDAHNNEYFARPLPAKALEDAMVTLAGLEAGRTYEVTVETVGYRSGDVYNEYLDGSFDELPTREQIAELIEKSRPKIRTLRVSADESGTLRLSIPQSENQADLIRISL